MPLAKAESNELFQKIFSDEKNLVALPNIILKLITEIDDPDSEMKDMQVIINKDPALTAKILKLANSAYYGHTREIDTLSQALVTIGLRALKDLVVAERLLTTFFGDACKGYNLKRGELWSHSISTAIAAELIIEHIDHRSAEKYFIAGLLHDIGKILLGRYLGDYITEILLLVKNEKLTFDKAEEAVLGFSHCEIGAELCKKWEFPHFYYEVIKFHHEPALCMSAYKPLVEIIHIADIFSYRLHNGMGVDNSAYRIKKALMDKINLKEKDESQLMQNLRLKYKEFFQAIFI